MNSYPRFISNSPCGEDLFEGKSQQKIATNICTVIKTEKSCKIIGIDGGWGSGKSNLVGQVEKMLSKESYHFFIYDAWGHQEDLQRRSFLEELTEFLTDDKNKVLEGGLWKSKLKKLLAKTKETESKRTPKLSLGIIISALAILITPLFKSISDKVEKIDTLPYHNLLSLLILSVPLLLLIGLFIYFFLNEKEGSFKKKIKNSFTRLFLEYQNKLEEEIKYEMISEEEPSVRKFRSWMDGISKDLGSNNLILVFDNMDRLPQRKVQELWSSIHVFFSEHSYDNIKVIIPFDREHIRLAFKSEDIKEKQYGDDFINKTFNVVYRVSPPILSDWKSYFSTQWKLAFGKEDSLRNGTNVLQIFDLLSEEITPRRIIAFINEFVSIKLTFQDSIPDNYIALFILGKPTIVKNPIDEIVNPTYLKSLFYLYAGDEELPKFISALFYQVDPDKAIQVIFTDRIKRALNENDGSELEKISSIPEFYPVLENAIADVSNYENAILALDSVPSDKIGEKHQAEIIWNSLYKKVAPRNKSRISEYQLILLSKISKQKEYLRTILDELISDTSFSAIDYFYSLNEIYNKFQDSLQVFSEINTKQTSVQDFIAFVRMAQKNYAKYKIKVDNKGLNDYLIELEIPKLKEIEFLSYLTKEYSFDTFTQRLEDLIKVNAPNNDKELMGVLYARYKEVAKEKPLQVKLDDSYIYSLFINSTKEEDFYFDLIAMRMARLDKFNTSYSSTFDSVLQSTEDDVITKISNRIEFYLDYGGVLLGLKVFNTYPLYKEVVNRLTKQPVGASRANVSKVVSIFQQICELGEIEPKKLLQRLNAWENYFKKDITSDNIKGIASPFFFTQSVNEEFGICTHCIMIVTEYLNSLSKEDWKGSFKDFKSYEIEVGLIINYKFSTNSFEGLKDILNEITLGLVPIPDKKTSEILIEKFEEQGRNFKATFNTIRDTICRSNCMTVPLFKYIGSWLLKYADLEKNQASLRTIFTSDVIHDSECLQIVFSYKEKMPAILSAANQEAEDFKEIIKDKLSTDTSDSYIEFARSIGVEIEKNDGTDPEQKDE